jgi:hypothetical protein
MGGIQVFFKVGGEGVWVGEGMGGLLIYQKCINTMLVRGYPNLQSNIKVYELRTFVRTRIYFVKT